MKRILLLFLPVVIFGGCSGLSEISLEGNWLDKSGKIVFSLDETQTKDNQTPVFVDQDKERHYLLDSQTIDKIVDKIREYKGEVAGLAISQNGKYKQLMEIIRKEESEK